MLVVRWLQLIFLWNKSKLMPLFMMELFMLMHVGAAYYTGGLYGGVLQGGAALCWCSMFMVQLFVIGLFLVVQHIMGEVFKLELFMVVQRFMLVQHICWRSLWWSSSWWCSILWGRWDEWMLRLGWASTHAAAAKQPNMTWWRRAHQRAKARLPTSRGWVAANKIRGLSIVNCTRIKELLSDMSTAASSDVLGNDLNAEEGAIYD